MLPENEPAFLTRLSETHRELFPLRVCLVGLGVLRGVVVQHLRAENAEVVLEAPVVEYLEALELREVLRGVEVLFVKPLSLAAQVALQVAEFGHVVRVELAQVKYEHLEEELRAVRAL